MRAKNSGYALIEALVAIVIVAIGSFGVVKLNAVTLRESGLNKARTQAIQLAQNVLEIARDPAAGIGCTSPGTTTFTATGSYNETFVVQTQTATTSTNRINVAVCVGWDGSAAPCSSASRNVVRLNSAMACAPMGTTGLVGGGGMALTGGFMKTPTGSATVGGGSYDPNNLPAGTQNNITVGGENVGTDGTRVITSGGKVELVDESTGKVLLTIPNSTNGGFSTISGRILIEAESNGDAMVNPQGLTSSLLDDIVFILSSDASVCTRKFVGGVLGPLPTSATGSGVKYRVFYYQCYVSKGWWGNIGIVRLDNANVNDRVCVGDPAVTNDNTTWSKHPVLSSFRGYRAYRQVSSDPVKYDTIGIGISVSDGTSYSSVNLGANVAATGRHDFLITRLTGSNASCKASGKMELTSPSSFTDNQGKFYCMSGQCPALINAGSPVTTVLNGTITAIPGQTVSFSSSPLDPDGVCQTKSFAAGQTANTWNYSCTVDWSGFSSSTWQALLKFSMSGNNTICGYGQTSSSEPADADYAVAINNRSARNSNSIAYTDIATSITQITVNVNAASSVSGCGALGQVNASWPATVSTGSPLSLQWSAIDQASGYRIQVCNVSASQKCNANAFSTLTTVSSSVLEFAPNGSGQTAIANGQKRCIRVQAMGSAGVSDGLYSPIKCVTLSGGTYTHN